MKNKFLALLFCLALSVSAQVQGPAVQSLYTFPSSLTNGAQPTGQLLLGSDGFLYGVTRIGGTGIDPYGVTCGTIFKINPTNGTFTSLVSFNFTNGARPNGDLAQNGSVLYGTTRSGGAYGEGALFASTTAGVMVTPYSFNYSPALGFTNGAWPNTGVILATSGFLYGVASGGGIGNSGTIYSTSTSGNLSTLYSFNSPGAVPSEDRANPAGNLLQITTSNFFGVAPVGGSNNVGFVYELTLAGVYSNLYSFISGTTGIYPRGQLLQTTDGNLYGVTEAGGSNGFGGIFKVPTNNFQVVALSAFNNTNGAYPSSDLIQSPVDGYMYGVSKTYLTNGGIYQASTNAGGLTNLTEFVITNGANPDGPLIYDTNTSNFYGVASVGGNSNGVIYTMLPAPILVSTNLVQTNTTGHQITNTAVVEGMPPLTFAWYHNNTNLIANGTQISGATTIALVLSNVAASNLGTYQLVLTNAYGSISNNVGLIQ